MRAVQAARSAVSKQALSQVNPKFHAGANELEKEGELKIIQPTNSEQLKQLTALVESLRRRNQNDPAWQNALRLWQSQIVTGALSDQVKFQFVRRFYFWLLGRGTDDDVKRTFWGRGNAAVINREVALYIEQFSQRRLDYALQLSLLAMRVPDTLNGYYLYFKYIVNGKLKRAKDNSGGEWWELSDDDYLQDFEMFQQEFDGPNNSGNYKDIIRPANDRRGGAASFDASRPYPASPAQNEQHKLLPRGDDEIVDGALHQAHASTKTTKPLPQAMDTEEDGMTDKPVRVEPENAEPVAVSVAAMGVEPNTQTAILIGELQALRQAVTTQLPAAFREAVQPLAARVSRGELKAEALEQHASLLGEALSQFKEAAKKKPTSPEAFESAQTAREAKVAADEAMGLTRKFDATLQEQFTELTKAINSNKPATAKEIGAAILSGTDPVTGVNLVQLIGRLTDETSRMRDFFGDFQKVLELPERRSIEREKRDAERLTIEAAKFAEREQQAKETLSIEQSRVHRLELELRVVNTRSARQAEAIAQRNAQLQAQEHALRNAAQQVAQSQNNMQRAGQLLQGTRAEAQAAIDQLRQKETAARQENAQWRNEYERLARDYQATLQRNNAMLTEIQAKQAEAAEVQRLAKALEEWDTAALQREEMEMTEEMASRLEEWDAQRTEEEEIARLESEMLAWNEKREKAEREAEANLRKFFAREEEQAWQETLASREEEGSLENRKRKEPEPSEPVQEERMKQQATIARKLINEVLAISKDNLKQQFGVDVDYLPDDAPEHIVAQEFHALQRLNQLLYEARPSREFIRTHLSGQKWRSYIARANEPANVNNDNNAPRARDDYGRFVKK